MSEPGGGFYRCQNQGEELWMSEQGGGVLNVRNRRRSYSVRTRGRSYRCQNQEEEL